MSDGRALRIGQQGKPVSEDRLLVPLGKVSLLFQVEKVLEVVEEHVELSEQLDLAGVDPSLGVCQTLLEERLERASVVVLNRAFDLVVAIIEVEVAEDVPNPTSGLDAPVPAEVEEGPEPCCDTEQDRAQGRHPFGGSP